MPCPIVEFDHHSHEYATDRLQILSNLRHNSPIAWTASNGGHWVITSYDLVRQVILDDKTFTAEYLPGRRGGITIPESDRPRIIPGETDGEEHTRYRVALRDRFSRPAIAGDRQWIQSLAEQAVDAVIERNDFDVVADLALPIPSAAVLHLLQLNVSNPVRYFRAVELAIGIRVEEDVDRDEDSIRADIESVWETLHSAVLEKRSNPDDGLISFLVQRDPPLSDLEIRDIVVSTVLGGARTTAALIENMLWYLDIDRNLRATLQADMSLIPKAVDEFVRLISPAQVVARTATRDVELGGVLVKEGDRVLVSWQSANHDESTFADPEEFRLDRPRRPHVGFGVGAHACLGTWLAKAEAEYTLQYVLTKMPEYKLDRANCKRYEDMLVNQWLVMPAVARP
ncbi:cytochrome P450 [Mycolicibacterium sp. ELW1]|uniref:cytochrome P450 n=1 Tax=Mycobacteriaceae TaxID=1762 RepID=UPI0011EBBA18|nr:cytochrome P450 [Mycobacterium sp. ELW1]QEN12944.1 cytochrome P450 [Mycobacterium sp. ELW1]